MNSSPISSISILRLCYSLPWASFTTLTQATMANRSKEHQTLAKEKRLLFARNFKEARLQARYKQEYVAVLSGLTQGFISDVEKGKSDVSLGNACLLANAVGQPLCKLLSSKEK